MGLLVLRSFLCDGSCFGKLVDWKSSFHIWEGFSFPTTTFLDCTVELVQTSGTGRRQSQELCLKFSLLTRPVYASPFGSAPMHCKDHRCAEWRSWELLRPFPCQVQCSMLTFWCGFPSFRGFVPKVQISIVSNSGVLGHGRGNCNFSNSTPFLLGLMVKK